MLFTTSALSHIFPEIRVDAVRFVNILLQIIPEVVVGDWTNRESDQSAHHKAETSATGSAASGQRVLDGYLALLDIRSSSGGVNISLS